MSLGLRSRCGPDRWFPHLARDGERVVDCYGARWLSDAEAFTLILNAYAPVIAATIDATGGADFATIRDAISAAELAHDALEDRLRDAIGKGGW